MLKFLKGFSIIIFVLIGSSCNNSTVTPAVSKLYNAFFNMICEKGTASFLTTAALPTEIKDFYAIQWGDDNKTLEEAEQPWSPASCYDTGMMLITNSHGDTLWNYTPDDASKNQLCLLLTNTKTKEYLVVYRQCAFKSWCYIDYFKIVDTANEHEKILKVQSAVARTQITNIQDLIETIKKKNYVDIGRVKMNNVVIKV